MVRLSQYTDQGQRAYTLYQELGRTFSTKDASRVLGIPHIGPVMASFRVNGIIVHTGENTNGKKKCTIPQQRWGEKRHTKWEFPEEIIKKFEWWKRREETGVTYREYKKAKA